MKNLLILTTLTAAFSAAAEPPKSTQETQQQLARMNASLEQLVSLTKEAKVPQKKAVSSEPKNPLVFCYAGEKAYSEGAKVEQRICARQAADVLENSRQRALVWRKASNIE